MLCSCAEMADGGGCGACRPRVSRRQQWQQRGVAAARGGSSAGWQQRTAVAVGVAAGVAARTPSGSQRASTSPCAGAASCATCGRHGCRTMYADARRACGRSGGSSGYDADGHEEVLAIAGETLGAGPPVQRAQRSVRSRPPPDQGPQGWGTRDRTGCTCGRQDRTSGSRGRATGRRDGGAMGNGRRRTVRDGIGGERGMGRRARRGWGVEWPGSDQGKDARKGDRDGAGAGRGQCSGGGRVGWGSCRRLRWGGSIRTRRGWGGGSLGWVAMTMRNPTGRSSHAPQPHRREAAASQPAAQPAPPSSSPPPPPSASTAAPVSRDPATSSRKRAPPAGAVRMHDRERARKRNGRSSELHPQFPPFCVVSE